MGNFLLLAVWMLLLASCGANAARLYPTHQQVKVQESSTRNATSLLLSQRLLGRYSPLDSESGSLVQYSAEHRTAASDEGFYGFIATMDVYGFDLSPEQYTVGWVTLFDQGDGAVTSLSVVQIGWEVSPKTYGDSRTHLGGTWTNDGFQKTGCPNTGCGFQPEKGAPIALGDVIDTVSQPKGVKQSITIKIMKDGRMGDWLVYYGLNQDEPALIGRFPRSLFTGGMANRAAGIQFGGFVKCPSTNLAPMGSGYLPTDDASAAASMSNIQFVDENGVASLVIQDSQTVVDDSNIYGVTPISHGQFFFGGPLQPST